MLGYSSFLLFWVSMLEFQIRYSPQFIGLFWFKNPRGGIEFNSAAKLKFDVYKQGKNR